jgi:Arc/MetJ-type ribon-helix-helix transcriptional regulator
MGRRRKPDKGPTTTMAISVDTLGTISKLKRRETQDDFIRRLLTEWQDFHDYKLDMDQVLKLKDRQILMLENELKEKLLQQEQQKQNS